MVSLTTNCILICLCASLSKGDSHNSSTSISHPLTPKKLSPQSSSREDRDDYPPKASPPHHWYVVYLKGLQKTKESSLKKEQFSLDLKASIASKMSVPQSEITLNKLVLRGNELSVNFSVGSREQSRFLQQLGRLVSNDVFVFSGDRYIIFRILRSDNLRALGLIHGLSYTHPYNGKGITFLQETSDDKHSEHERVELMFYLTVGGLCIFLFVLALSFLAIQFMKAGALSYIDEDYEEGCEDDSKQLIKEEDERLPVISSRSLETPRIDPWARIPSGKIASKVVSKWLPSSLRSSGRVIDVNH